MRTLLIIGSVVEVALVLAAVAVYLHFVAKSLRRSAKLLAEVTWGVRAVDSQTAPIGPVVTKINGQLATIAGALAGVAALAEQVGATKSARP
ncbi:MAG: hypothetical protein NVS3B21_30420 [Acidimicrobiales bacterium]